eukprot:47263-Hanusia_phi.AAC.1
MVYQFDGSYLGSLPRKSCRFQKLQEEGERTLSEDDLAQKIEAYARRSPQSRSSSACAAGACTSSAIAKAIRLTCRHLKEEQERVPSQPVTGPPRPQTSSARRWKKTRSRMLRDTCPERGPA